MVFIHIANQNVQIATDIVRYDISPESLDMEKKGRKQERNGLKMSCMTVTDPANRASLSQNRVIVVCSARSTGKKAEGTTSRYVYALVFLYTETLCNVNWHDLSTNGAIDYSPSTASSEVSAQVGRGQRVELVGVVTVTVQL